MDIVKMGAQDEALGGGLDLLFSLGYIPNGKQIIMDNWPRIEIH